MHPTAKYATAGALALLLAAPGFAATWQVPGDFATIQAAVDAAADGDTIELTARSYSENVSVDGKSVAFRGVASGGRSRVTTVSSSLPTFDVRNAASTAFENMEVIWDGQDVDVPAIGIVGGALLISGCHLSRNSSTRWSLKAIDVDSVVVRSSTTSGQGLYVLRCPTVNTTDVHTLTHTLDGDGKVWFEDCQDVRVVRGNFEGYFVLCDRVSVSGTRLSRGEGEIKPPASASRAYCWSPDYPVRSSEATITSNRITPSQAVDPFDNRLAYSFVGCADVEMIDVKPLPASAGCDFGGTVSVSSCTDFKMRDVRIPWGTVDAGSVLVSETPYVTIRSCTIGGRNGVPACWEGHCIGGNYVGPFLECVLWQVTQYTWNRSGLPAIVLTGNVRAVLIASTIAGGDAGPPYAYAGGSFQTLYSLLGGTSGSTGACAITRNGTGRVHVYNRGSSLLGGATGRLDITTYGGVKYYSTGDEFSPAVSPGIVVTQLSGESSDDLAAWIAY